MAKKFYQSIDNIHRTIYYTELERHVISTPFFTRLHDVNQNSIVYLNFSTNRTKRYEHSLGTMQLASDLLYNASINSVGTKPFDFFLNKLTLEFNKIEDTIKFKDRTNIFYIDKNNEKETETLENLLGIDSFKEFIEDNFYTYFKDNCLINLVPNGLTSNTETFLFLCVLQAIRLVGILHDSGHPPQSHIIESVLQEIYDILIKIEIDCRTKRQEKFISIIRKFKECNTSYIEDIDKNMLIKTEFAESGALHEMIGLFINETITLSLFPELSNNISNSSNEKRNLFMIYYITVFEFMFAIFRNKNIFWNSLHEIVDGTIDADRFDYIIRDSQNSGMVWGKIPYKQIINTVKFGLVQESLVQENNKSELKDKEVLRITLCFSDKNINDLNDIIINRFKIFSNINYHHRSAQMAMLYQKAVKLISLEYLSNDGTELYNSGYYNDISGLWRDMEIAYSPRVTTNNIIQWNDSWLNGILYQKLLERYNKNDTPEYVEYLEEIFLNKRRYFPLIKRNSDLVEINLALKNDKDNLKKIIYNEIQKTANTNFVETILKPTLESLITFDFNRLSNIYGINIIDEKAVLEILKDFDNLKNINVTVYVKKIDYSLGINDKVYIYNSNEEIKSYFDCSCIKETLLSMRSMSPYFYIYLKCNIKINNEDLSEIRKHIGEYIYNNIKESIYSRLTI